MAKETVQAVRQAELKAAELERDTLSKKEKILSDAQLEAKTLVAAMTKQANETAERNLIKANQQGEQMMEAAKQRAEAEVIMMREMAKSKEEAAINLVLSNVI
jgi:V/A-type H+/Na+-transporting ATPase subunit G/H